MQVTHKFCSWLILFLLGNNADTWRNILLFKQMEKHLNSQNTAADNKHIINCILKHRLSSKLTNQHCCFVAWHTISLSQTGLQNGKTASTSRPFWLYFVTVALNYGEHRPLHWSWSLHNIITRGLLSSANSFSTNIFCASAKPLSQCPAAMASLFCRLTCSPCRRGGEYLQYQQVLVASSLNNLGKRML